MFILKKSQLGKIEVFLQKQQKRHRKKRPYSELFWSVFSRIRTECGEMRSTEYHFLLTEILRYRVSFLTNTTACNEVYILPGEKLEFSELGKRQCFHR